METIEQRLARLEADNVAHGITIKFMLLKLEPDRAMRDAMREEICDALERVLLARGFSHDLVLRALHEVETVFPQARPKPDA